MNLRLLTLLLSVTAGSVWAQPAATPSPEVFWQLTAGTATAPASPANDVLLQQAGTGHQAMIAVLGQQNQISLSQTANANAATVQLTGRGNQLQLNQAGDGNRLAVGLDGTNNQLRVSQSGGDVVSLLGLSGSNARIDLIQRNGNNTIIADGLTVPTTSAGMGVANLKIEQSGGATIRIQNGRP
ncbi:hypothetical protein [Spirosoma pollinicola]|uniref:Curlin n=1 Tax=Spirosoma pollinicola TaxID=2057025 RepID=A0A2K8YUY5_9BACT|nr:hypothetical protein [Spirosoma pollinicola]AUD01431.1 hypothetical protein CWM47_06170 [Spirosoma pollinicola]